MKEEKEISISEILRIIVTKVSYVNSYKTLNENRRDILSVVISDLINLSNALEIKEITSLKKEGKK